MDTTVNNPPSFADDQKELAKQIKAWANALPRSLKASVGDNEVRIGKVQVNFDSRAQQSTQSLQYCKKKYAVDGGELYFVYPWELAQLPRILSHFNSRLELDSRKFAAKRLLLEIIPQKEADAFAKEFHIQGSARGTGKVSYGLRAPKTKELLAVQQYCLTRWSLKKTDAQSNVWEGLRLVIKADVQIHGAATRLQKAFLDENKPSELMSYVDYSHSLGTYKTAQGFENTFTSRESYMWCLTGTPKDVAIVDKNGVTRHPDLALVAQTPYLNPNRMAGAFGKGVGQTFYGGKLGSRAELKAQGNTELFHNDLIMEAIGYTRIFTAGQLRWHKHFDN